MIYNFDKTISSGVPRDAGEGAPKVLGQVPTYRNIYGIYILGR